MSSRSNDNWKLLMPFVLPKEYAKCPKGWERDAIFLLLKRLFGRAPIAIDFLDGDCRAVSTLDPIVHVAPPRLKKILWILFDPSMLLPNAYVDGHWFVSKGRLQDLVLLLTTRHGKRQTNLGLIGVVPRYIRHLSKQRIDTSQTRETKSHYNIDDELYRLIIGPSMVYSCAFFESGAITLEEAQSEKLSKTVDRLALPSGETSVLDIGCGWGALTRRIAESSQASVIGISISKNQIEHCKRCASNDDFSAQNSLRYFEKDYLELKGEFERIVSIGMLEHVGKRDLPLFFSTVQRCLSENGRAVIHTITRPDSGTTNRWVDENIFSGGYIPRGSEVLRAIEVSGMVVDTIYYHSGENYRRTLEMWLENLYRNRSAIESLHKAKIHSEKPGLDDLRAQSVAERGYRVWEFYLSALQNIFHSKGGRFSIVQYCLTN